MNGASANVSVERKSVVLLTCEDHTTALHEDIVDLQNRGGIQAQQAVVLIEIAVPFILSSLPNGR
jgi:hypothetical protein